MTDPSQSRPAILCPAQVGTQSMGRLKISITSGAGYTPVPVPPSESHIWEIRIR